LLLLATALLIWFSRPHDAVARIGALGLATLSVSLVQWAHFPAGCAAIWRTLPPVVGVVLWVPTLASYLVGPILLTFFVLYPRALVRARWAWAIMWLPALCFVPAFLHDAFLIVYRPAQAFGHLLPNEVLFAGTRLFGLFGLLALAALGVNFFRLTDLNDRRRLRVLLVGGAAAVLPGAFRLLVWRSTSGVWDWLSSGGPDILLAAVFVLFPASLAYSILRHRLLDIRLIIRQGVQYAAARGTLLSVVPLLGVLLVADLLVHGDQPLIGILEARGWVYLALGTAAAGAHSQRRRWGEAIDRRFFRERCDARRLLREIAAESGRGRSFAGAAPGVVARIEAALHPEFAAVMHRPVADTYFRTLACSPADKAPPPIAAESRLVSVLRTLGDPLDVLLGESSWLQDRLPHREIEDVRRARMDLIVPIAVAPAGPEALLALGVKRSEEPFTREDRELLSEIASNLELLLGRPEVPPARSTEGFEECPLCGTCYETGAGHCAQEGAELTTTRLSRVLAGRYRLERRLGRGGMGSVYEATDGVLARLVAVKVIREDRLGSPAAVQRFQREARAAAGFSHPNVVTVYDHGIDGGARAFLVMELLQGATLRDELRARQRLEGGRVVGIFRGLCSAVEAAHLHQLIHRDLKPENIFLVRGNKAESETVKVLDFGIAKFLPSREQGAETLTGGETDAGILMGTPGYMAPEQLLGDEPDVSWDLWALAVTAYETLTGGLPFPAASWAQWRRSVLAGRYVPLRERMVDPPADCEEFFARALSVDRARRPSSAAEFLRDLERALNPAPAPNGASCAPSGAAPAVDPLTPERER
jgi:serine/threonine-protein kinase